jgi:type IV pilus modification protein PilV
LAARRTTCRGPRGARGFTIAEIAAALLVIAVGIIGIAALYSDQVHTTDDTQLHMQAETLADAIAVRILATDAEHGRPGFATTIGVVCNPDAKPKLAIDVAAQEAACWQDEVEQKLPSGLGSITRDPSTNPVSYIVAVSWSPPGSGTASYVIRVGNAN